MMAGCGAPGRTWKLGYVSVRINTPDGSRLLSCLRKGGTRMTWEGMPHRSDEEFGEVTVSGLVVSDSEVTTDNLDELTDGSVTTLHSHPSETFTVGQLTTRVQTADAQGGADGFTLDLSEMGEPTSYVRFTRVLDLQGNPLENWVSAHGYLATDGKGSIPDEVYGGGFVWTCLTGGTSDSGEPDWSSPTDGQITDNDITWGDAVAVDSYVNLLGIASADGEGQRLTLFNDILRANVPINLIHEGGASGQELTLPGGADAVLPYHEAVELLYATGGEESYWVSTQGEPGTLTIGPSAAQSGAIRLENLTGTIVARNVNNDDNVTLLYLDDSDAITMRNDSGAGIRVFATGGTTLNNSSNSYISLGSNDSVDVAGASGSAGFFIAADGSISITTDAGKAITTGPIILPSSDPGIVGALWNNGGTPAISEG